MSISLGGIRHGYILTGPTAYVEEATDPDAPSLTPELPRARKNPLGRTKLKTGQHHVAVLTWSEKFVEDGGRFLAKYDYERCACGETVVMAQSLCTGPDSEAFESGDGILGRHFGYLHRGDPEIGEDKIHILPKVTGYVRTKSSLTLAFSRLRQNKAEVREATARKHERKR